MAKQRATTICVTPAKNESWIIRSFVTAAQRWADHIVIADQSSTDGTFEFIQQQPKVIAIKNDYPEYDEEYRQRLLLDNARRIAGKRILIGLDADEALSANAFASEEWRMLTEAPVGTILRFRWANILPGFRQAWITPNFVPFGFVDDGSQHHGKRIHSPRVPQPPGAPTIDFEEIVVLHFQYVDWERMLSKQRWYQAWEFLKNKQKSALEIYREYNHMNGSWRSEELQEVDPAWFKGYESAGINFKQLKSEKVTWWDREVLSLMLEHGSACFRKAALWDKNWKGVAESMGLNQQHANDPRSRLDKIIHRLLAASQGRRHTWYVRLFEKALRLSGW